MLQDYNRFDYELLLRRARIRQCLDRYDEAVVDAGLALKANPSRLEAYHLLSDCLIATQRFNEASKLLEVLQKRDPENTSSSQYQTLVKNAASNESETLVQKYYAAHYAWV